jgi:hypothetical protein
MLQGELAPQEEEMGQQNLFWQLLPAVVQQKATNHRGPLRHLLQTRAGQRSSTTELMMRDLHW